MSRGQAAWYEILDIVYYCMLSWEYVCKYAKFIGDWTSKVCGANSNTRFKQDIWNQLKHYERVCLP